MPPSGFSQDAIRGLLVFVRELYQRTLEKYSGKNLTEERILSESISHLDKLVEDSVPKGLSYEGLMGLRKFVSSNFRDLIREIHEGKKEEGYAMQKEIKNIGDYLSRFKL